MATYTLHENDLIEIVVKGRLHGQTTRNVFHYRYAPEANDDDGSGALGIALAAFDDLVGVALRAIMSEEWHHQSNTIQKVRTTRYQLIEGVVNEDGAVTGPSLPSGAAAVVSIRGVVADRHSQGRKYFAGIPIEAAENSLLVPDFVTALESVAGDMLSTLPGNDVGVFVPTTLTPTYPGDITGLYDVTSVTAREIVRYQRRREVGVGE